MADNLDNQNPFAQHKAVWDHPTIRQCMADIDAVSDYSLPLQQRGPFLFYHSFITSNPPPMFITAWRNDPSRERWYHRHVNGVLGHVQNAIACVWYHRDNLHAIEERIRKIFIGSGAQLLLGNSTIGLGTTIRWDAEYQAFVLAVRRCLDYLARAMASFFQNDQNSFRKLPQFLKHAKPSSIALALMNAHQRHQENFQYVLSDGERKSIRDLLSHYEYISAGTLNLSSRGFLMHGGGENVKLTSGAWEGGLSTIIIKRADELHTCIADFLTSFVLSARQYEVNASDKQTGGPL